MERTILGILVIVCSGWPALGQSTETQPVFEAADIHVSAQTVNQVARGAGNAFRGARPQVKNATMADLIRMAYGFTADKTLGGPNWLELDHFDLTAKAPAGATPQIERLMLKSLLRDRFKLVLHEESRPLPTYVLTAGKKPQMKEADGFEENGCRPQSEAGSAGGGSTIYTTGANGAPLAITLGPDDAIRYTCRNVTMAEFAAALRGMFDASLGANGVTDETGLKGKWNFDFHYSLQSFGRDQGERISLTAAVEKQLGLKLEQRLAPTPVLVVDSVNRKPADNPPGTAEALASAPLPTEFEVASIRPSDPSAQMSRFQMPAGGRVVIENMPLGILIRRAFNTTNTEAIVGMPAFGPTAFDITAKAPVAAVAANLNMETVAPMLLALLKDRFKLAYHTEERPVTAYTLVAAKPKMKKADSASRIFCRDVFDVPGTPPESRVLQCQNITMAQFAERLPSISRDLNWPVLDATGIAGGWDFTLTLSVLPAAVLARMGRGGQPDPAAGAVPQAADPVFEGYSIFEALEKQLGLKLEPQKRPESVIVIDHIERKPTDN